MSSKWPTFRIICLAFFFAWITGCTTHSKRIANLRQSFHQGDLETASEETERLLSKNKKDESLIQLEKSLVRLAEGNPHEAERILVGVRNEFAAQNSVPDLSNVSSFLLDDQSRTYKPDDYEQLFVLMYLAITNLMQNGDDAYAYSNQITALQAQFERLYQDQKTSDQKQKTGDQASNDEPSEDQISANNGPHEQSVVFHASNQPIDNPQSSHQRIALAPFIAGLLHEQTHRDYDSAERYYRKTLELNPSFGEAIRGLHRVREGHHSEKGNGVLYIFAAVGKGPVKIERAEVPTSNALLIADRILSATGDHTLPPTIAPIKTARVIVPQNAIQGVRVLVNQNDVGETETITDLGQVAIAQDRAKQDVEMARAVVRRIIKKSAIYMGKDALETTNHSGIDLLINLGGVLWEAAETADTRCWGLLPEKIQVLRVELPTGTHQVELAPIGVSSPERNLATVEIFDGRNSYMFASFPTGKLAGQVIVSRH